MFELILLVVVVIGMGKIAASEGQSGIIWGAMTMLVGIACLALVPLPFLRVPGAGIATFAAYVGYKVVAKK